MISVISLQLFRSIYLSFLRSTPNTNSTTIKRDSTEHSSFPPLNNYRSCFYLALIELLKVFLLMQKIVLEMRLKFVWCCKMHFVWFLKLELANQPAKLVSAFWGGGITKTYVPLSTTVTRKCQKVFEDFFTMEKNWAITFRRWNSIN